MAVTRDDVARRAGVSTAVVSYVLNDGPRPVSESARARVVAAIAELGYRRDGVARTLAGGRSRSVGLVVPDIAMPYFGGMAQAIAEAASDRQYRVLVGTSRWRLEDEHRQLQALAEQRVEGIVLMSIAPEQDVAPLEAVGVPIAIVDRPRFARDGAARLTEHLIGHGRRRIGLVTAAGWRTASERRVEGWAAALERAGLARGPLIDAAATERGGYDAAEALTECDAVLLETDVQALGLLRRLHELGRRCPAEVALASTDATSAAAYSTPSLTGLSQPSDDIASDALRSLLDGDAPPVGVLAREGFELVLRESCGCRPAR